MAIEIVDLSHESHDDFPFMANFSIGLPPVRRDPEVLAANLWLYRGHRRWMKTTTKAMCNVDTLW
jgi:hypothetical protein